MIIHNYNPYKTRKTYKYLTLHKPLTNTYLQKNFSDWCNQNAKNNPIIYINYPIDYNLYMSIYSTLPNIRIPLNKTLQRKTNIRFSQTGFPHVLKTKCATDLCNNWVSVTQKFPILKPNANQRFCPSCQSNIKKQNQQSDLINMMDSLTVNDMNHMDIN